MDELFSSESDGLPVASRSRVPNVPSSSRRQKMLACLQTCQKKRGKTVPPFLFKPVCPNGKRLTASWMRPS